MDGNQEAGLMCIEVTKVILPNGQLKRNIFLDTDSTVREEKEKILMEAQIPYPILYVMVVHGPNQSREVLDDSRTVESYVDVIGGGNEYEIYIEKKSSQVERPPRPINTQLFNVNLK